MSTTARTMWVELDATEAEPGPLSMILDDEGVTWVRPKTPGQADVWYRVGGGRGPSRLSWEDFEGPLFLGVVQPETTRTRPLAAAADG